MSISRRSLLAGAAASLTAVEAAPPSTPFDKYFLPILDGYLRNARRTSNSMAVCDFPDGTMLKNSLAKSGKTYDSVTRMLPALAAWVGGGRDRDGRATEALRLAYTNAFDPNHPDYWIESPPNRTNQRQVESSLVAWSLWLVRDRILPELTRGQRTNIQNWLASCTQHPVRNNNWGWFTAVNQAARLALADKWPEFSADAKWMEDDLRAMDALAAPGEGWYSDSPKEPIFDYYNFWVFASHFLYWNRMAGSRYREWSQRFSTRVKAFLERTPYFFSSAGGHVLFGRSLIYRWAVLTPLVLAYEQKLWPHSPALLRAIVQRNIDYHWKLGAFDKERGKLRETYSADGTAAIREAYVDNGHPYWGMQAYAFYLLPSKDPFWTAKPEPLPIDSRDYTVTFPGERMLLDGNKTSGQVCWLNPLTLRTGPEYRDKYTKFSYSSHFPFNIVEEKQNAAWDGTLIFHDPSSGEYALRAGVSSADLEPRGVVMRWWTTLSGERIEVTTRLQIDGPHEQRMHEIMLPPALLSKKIEAVEGSFPLGLGRGELYEAGSNDGWTWARSNENRLQIAAFGAAETFEHTGSNVIYPRTVVLTSRNTLTAQRTKLSRRYYAGPHTALHPPVKRS